MQLTKPAKFLPETFLYTREEKTIHVIQAGIRFHFMDSAHGLDCMAISIMERILWMKPQNFYVYTSPKKFLQRIVSKNDDTTRKTCVL